MKARVSTDDYVLGFVDIRDGNAEHHFEARAVVRVSTEEPLSMTLPDGTVHMTSAVTLIVLRDGGTIGTRIPVEELWPVIAKAMDLAHVRESR